MTPSSPLRSDLKRWARESKPGVYRGLSETEYDAIDAVRSTKLSYFADGRTPAHAKYLIDHPPPPKDHLDIGAALHCAVLEPEKFDDEWVVAPKVDRRYKKDKAIWAEFEAENAGKGILKRQDMNLVLAMRDGVNRNELARRLLKGAGQNELTLVWEDEQSGLLCKARLDRITEYEGYVIVVDLKTTARLASKEAFARAMGDFGYHRQEAFYRMAMDAHFGEMPRRFVFIVIEKAAPHIVATHETGPESLDAGQREVRTHLTEYAACTESGVWPGYGTSTLLTELPPWRLRRVERDEEVVF